MIHDDQLEVSARTAGRLVAELGSSTLARITEELDLAR